MNGYKFEIETPEGQVVPHYIEADSVEYNNDTVNLDVQTVQQAIEKLQTTIGRIELPEITVNDQGNWEINGEDTGHSASGVSNMSFTWARGNSDTNAPTSSSSWTNTPQLPTKQYPYLWMKVTYVVNGETVVAPGTPCILMVYQPSNGGDNTGSANIQVIDSEEALAEMERHPQPNTLYFFT